MTSTPAPDGIPAIDLDPFAEDELRNPAAFHARLREAGPVAWLSRHGVYATGRFEPAGEVLSDWKRFTSSRGVGMLDFAKAEPWWREKAVLIESDPPRHNEIRNLVGRVLAPASVAAFKDDFTAQAHALLDRALQSDQIDAHRDLAEVYPLKVFGDALGIDADNREQLLMFGDMGFNNFGPQNAVLERSMALRQGGRHDRVDDGAHETQRGTRGQHRGSAACAVGEWSSYTCRSLERDARAADGRRRHDDHGAWPCAALSCERSNAVPSPAR